MSGKVNLKTSKNENQSLKIDHEPCLKRVWSK